SPSAKVTSMAVTRSIELKTEIPGPRSREILARKERVVAEPLSIFLPVVVEEGHGATVTDVDGNTFIDFTGGVGCLNVGHSHPQVVAAAQEQLARFSHTDFTIVPYEVYVTLAERLCELAPVRKPAKAAFFNAGAEAVENAIKFARSFTGRPAVIGFEGGFLVARPGFRRGGRRLCDETGIVLVVAKVQPVTAAPARCGASSMRASSPTWSRSRSRSPTACRSRRSSARPRSWTRPATRP